MQEHKGPTPCVGGILDLFYVLVWSIQFTFCSRPEAAIVVISGMFMRQPIADRAVKCGDPWLNRSREIRPIDAGGAIFEGFGVLPYYHRARRPSFVVRHRVRQSYISRIVWPIINKFYADIKTDRLYIHTGYGVTIYFRSDVIAKSSSKMPHRRLRVEFLENGLSEDPENSGTTGRTNFPDMTSLAFSGWLQNAIK